METTRPALVHALQTGYSRWKRVFKGSLLIFFKCFFFTIPYSINQIFVLQKSTFVLPLFLHLKKRVFLELFSLLFHFPMSSPIFSVGYSLGISTTVPLDHIYINASNIKNSTCLLNVLSSCEHTVCTLPSSLILSPCEHTVCTLPSPFSFVPLWAHCVYPPIPFSLVPPVSTLCVPSHPV